MVRFGVFEALFNEIDLPFWCFDARRGLLFERVKDINVALELRRIHAPIGVSIVIRHDLYRVDAAHRAGGNVGFSILCAVDRAPNLPANLRRKAVYLLA